MDNERRITVTINKEKWVLTEEFRGKGHPVYSSLQWGIGPIEIVRILRRIGIAVTVEVEP